MTERKPVPTGVVIGALSATLVRRQDSMTRVGHGRADLGHDVDAGLLDLPLDVDAGGLDAELGGLGQLGADAVAGDQGHFMGHVERLSVSPRDPGAEIAAAGRR